MSKTVEIKLNTAGVKELLRSDEMESMIEDIASGIAGRCGEGFEYDTKIGKNRAHGSVYTDTPEAMAKNNKHNLILKNLR